MDARFYVVLVVVQKIISKKNLNGFIFENNNQLSLNNHMLKMVVNKNKFFKKQNRNRLHLESYLSRKNFDTFFEKLVK